MIQKMFLLVICMSFLFPGRGFSRQERERGAFSVGSTPEKILLYRDRDGFLALDKFRQLCRFLVDDDLNFYKKFPIKKRKNAFKRHVKNLCEEMEVKYLLKQQIKDDEEEILWELEHLKISLVSKSISDYKGVTLKDKIGMQVSTSLSFIKNRYPMKTGSLSKEAFNIEKSEDDSADILSQKDPMDSPFWHHIPTNIEPHQMFKKLAKLKKIQVEDEVVAFFDKSSFDGSAPKVKLVDLDFNNGWSLKWGDEVHSDALGSRIFAAFGYDVDHPYFFGKDKVTVLFPKFGEVKNAADLIKSIQDLYHVDLNQFITSRGEVDEEMAILNGKLQNYLGYSYVRFYKCALEARPDRVKRIGFMASQSLFNSKRRELRGSTLLHLWIGNWDTREENTMMSTIHTGNYHYLPSAAFNDLGTSFGLYIHLFPSDFKAGLVNHFSFDLVKKSRDILGRKVLAFDHKFNHFYSFFKEATYSDLRWMALKLAKLDADNLKKMIAKSGWPEPIAELYYHKLASRRSQILQVFEIEDPNPMIFDRSLNLTYHNEQVVKNGVLMKEILPESNPEGFLNKKGRFRNYGSKK